MSGFSDPIIGGQGTLIRAAIQSANFVHGVSGWQIAKTGSAEFNNLTIRGTFLGTDFIVNSTGAFFYSGTPASGNLIASIVPGISPVTDPEGNTAQPGICSYGGSGNSLISQLFTGGLQLGTAAQLDFTSGDEPGGVSTIVFGSGAGISVNSGSIGVSDAVAAVQLLSALASSVTNGKVNLVAGNVTFGVSGGALWNDNATANAPNGELLLPASGGPYVNGEVFHTVSNGTNFSGTMRVKLLPWNAVWIDVQVTYSTTAAVTANFGSLPSAAYYPVAQRQLPLSCNVAPTAVSSTPRIFLPTSGAVQLIVPGTMASSGAQFSLSAMYPTN